jgi:2-succinyl-6-hydroxy-2,4-cyclohexadiene-1-carboxylate synthase
VARRAVLLHGFTQTGSSWDGVVRALGPDWHAAPPDLRGHGHAADVRPVSFAAVRGDLDAIVGEGTDVLAGYSMGGRLALDWALRDPRRIGRLVLVSSTAGIADPEERERRRRADDALAARLLANGLEAFADEWGAQDVFAGEPAAVSGLARAQRLRQTPAGLAAALRGLGTGAMEPLWDRLGELALPVRLVVGERDAKFRAIAERMAAALPDARVTTVPGAGHSLPLEAPAAVADAIREP